MLLTTGRLTHFLRTFGAADGIPVLLLHGSYATGRWWERFAAALPEQFYAVAPDLRGCGGSEHTAAGYEISPSRMTLPHWQRRWNGRSSTWSATLLVERWPWNSPCAIRNCFPA